MISLATEPMNKIVIEGTTINGKKFRPSDWAERMSGALSTFGKDQRIQYSPLLQPLTVNGVKCVALDPSMKETHPEMFSYIMHWAEANQLKVINTGDSKDQSTLLAVGQ